MPLVQVRESKPRSWVKKVTKSASYTCKCVVRPTNSAIAFSNLATAGGSGYMEQGCVMGLWHVKKVLQKTPNNLELKHCSAPVQIGVDPQMQRAQDGDCCYGQRGETAPWLFRASASSAGSTVPEDQYSPVACRKHIDLFCKIDDFCSGIIPQLGVQGS